ncbi:hypothetical protein C0389_09105 [bacterium]|nr:hypothetical protein [bacterium]
MSTIKLKADQKKTFTKQLSKKYKSVEEEREELEKKTLRAKADRTKNLLENVSTNLDILDIDNFDALFPDMLTSMKEAAVLRDELIKEVGLEELAENRPELFSTAKQIEKKFDNVVERYSQEGKRLEKELSGVISSKKITNYLRY